MKIMGLLAIEKIGLGTRGLWRRVQQSHFARDVLLLSGGTGISQVIAVAVLPLLTRLYSPEDFGVLTLFISIVTLLSFFTSFNYELMIVLSRSHRSASQLVWLILAITCGIASFALLIIALVRNEFSELLGVPELAAWLYAVPVLIVCASSYQALRYWKMRLAQFAVVSRSMVARSITFATSAPLFAFIPFGTQHSAGLILAFIASEIVKTIVLIESLRKGDSKLAPARRLRIVAVARRHGPMALTTSVSTGMSLIYDRIPDLMISFFYGAATLGLYGIVGRVVAAPSQLVSKAIGDVYRQRASVLHRTEGRFDALTLKTIATTALISFVPFLLAIIYAPRIAAIVLGPDWETAGRYASILLVGEFFAFIMTPIDNATLIVGAKRFILFWSFARLILTLSLYPVLRSGMLDFFGFLWGIVAIRILMVSLYGVAALQYSRTGRPELEMPSWWRSG